MRIDLDRGERAAERRVDVDRCRCFSGPARVDAAMLPLKPIGAGAATFSSARMSRNCSMRALVSAIVCCSACVSARRAAIPVTVREGFATVSPTVKVEMLSASTATSAGNCRCVSGGDLGTLATEAKCTRSACKRLEVQLQRAQLVRLHAVAQALDVDRGSGGRDANASGREVAADLADGSSIDTMPPVKTSRCAAAAGARRYCSARQAAVRRQQRRATRSRCR